MEKARLVNLQHYFLCLSILHVQRVPNDRATERQNWRNTHPENVQWEELEWKVFSRYQGLGEEENSKGISIQAALITPTSAPVTQTVLQTAYAYEYIHVCTAIY